jgi:hypothetical protein
VLERLAANDYGNGDIDDVSLKMMMMVAVRTAVFYLLLHNKLPSKP